MRILQRFGTKILVLALVVIAALTCSFSLFACGDETPKDSGNETAASETITNETRSNACKDAATAIGNAITGKSDGNKQFSFVETTSNPYNETSLTLVYYIGLLYEDEGFNITENPAHFGGKYDYDFGNSGNITIYDIYLTAYAIFDKENSKFSLYFSQEMHNDMFDVESEIFLDIDYDFETKTVGDIYLYVGNDGEVICCAKVSGGKSYDLSLSEHDEEYNTFMNNYTTIDTNFTALKANTVNLTQDLRSKFVQAQLYGDNLLGQISGISVHSDQ